MNIATNRPNQIEKKYPIGDCCTRKVVRKSQIRLLRSPSLAMKMEVLSVQNHIQGQFGVIGTTKVKGKFSRLFIRIFIFSSVH